VPLSASIKAVGLIRSQLFILKARAEIINHSRRLMLLIADSSVPLWSRFSQRGDSDQPQATKSLTRRAVVASPHHMRTQISANASVGKTTNRKHDTWVGRDRACAVATGLRSQFPRRIRALESDQS